MDFRYASDGLSDKWKRKEIILKNIYVVQRTKEKL